MDREPLVAALMHASRGLVGIAAASIAAEEQVTLVQYRALVVVGRRPDCTVSDLAAALEVHPTTATRMAERLVAKGLVERQEGTVDRRTTVLHLTHGGQQLVRRVLDRRRDAIHRVVDRLDPGTTTAAVEALEQLAAVADEGAGIDPFAWDGPT